MRLRVAFAVLIALPVAVTGFENSSDALIEAARSDDQQAVMEFLRRGVDVNSRDEDGTTALALAANHNNLAMAELLLSKGANPDLANELGIGPLSLAISNASAPMVALVIGRGANPDVARENGETPLMTAARMGQVETMKLLLSRGANVNARDKKFGQTALMWAAGHPDIVDLLVKHGADVRTVTTTWDVKYTIYAPTTVTLGKTGIPWNTDGAYNSKKGGLNALFFAVQKHDLESARILLDAGADVNSRAADGTTPLLAALYNWDPPDLTFIPGKEPLPKRVRRRSIAQISQWPLFFSSAARNWVRLMAPAIQRSMRRRSRWQTQP